MPNTRPLTSEELDDGWFLEEEPVESEFESYELSEAPSAEPVGYEASPQFSEAYAAYLEDRPQRDISPSSPVWGLKAFGKA